MKGYCILNKRTRKLESGLTNNILSLKRRMSLVEQGLYAGQFGIYHYEHVETPNGFVTRTKPYTGRKNG